MLVIASVHRDAGIHRAVLDSIGILTRAANREPYESGGMGRTRNGARDGHILNHRAAADVAEWSRAHGRCLTDADVERLAVAVERSREGVVTGADGGSDGTAAVVPRVTEPVAFVDIRAAVDV